ncbi:mitochondrial RNA pseudouridine synthase Rpusd4-like [Protopterus annectens]|uniref:mitochondrial RNA pseudouridine synthase Rpusd4-like n=1 Tax=Protopterus annectens TaxID=7888 RepID=UPI001CFA2B7F|nr:mitochondrial RNA pseudouridine synthase Rpusd4-like [Protopterus annectens]
MAAPMLRSIFRFYCNSPGLRSLHGRSIKVGAGLQGEEASGDRVDTRPRRERRGKERSDPAAGTGLEEEQSPPSPRAQQLAERLREEKRREQQKKKPNTVPLDPIARRAHELRQLGLHLQRVPPTILAKELKRGVLYQDEEIVAINKPYGIPVHGGPGVQNSITDALPALAKMMYGMHEQPLHLCHRLDKETTGAMVLARNAEVAQRIHHYFKTHQVLKKYWVISVGIPNPTTGIIDIPIMEKEVTSGQPHFKMTVSPLYRISNEEGKLLRARKNRDSHSAVTQFTVLDSFGACALVELIPTTGVKHQIRVHMAYGLSCPVLGDHKYSHWNKLAPQKLSEGTLKKLGLNQAKARYLPLHLHARQLTLPGVEGQPEINLVCKLPKFFTSSLKRLFLEVPKGDDKA